MEIKTLVGYLNHWMDVRGNNVAIIDGDTKYTYKQLAGYVIELQESIIKAGIKEGDCVVVSCSKHTYMVALYLALFGLGVSACPLDNEWNIDSMKRIIDKINPKIIIVDNNVCVCKSNDISRIVDESKFLPHSIGYFLKDELIDIIAYPANLDNIHVFKSKLRPFIFEPSILNSCYDNSNGRTVYYNMTSGSTGEPLIANVGELEIIENAKSYNTQFPLKSEDCYGCLFPPYMHPHEIFARVIVAGSSMILLSLNHIKDLGKYVTKNMVSQIMGTPSTFETILKIGINSNDWSSIKYAFSTGESTPYKLKLDFYKYTKKKLWPVWGSTETGGVVFYVPEKWLLSDDALLGLPMKGYKTKIDKENGELLIKGSGCFSGYLNNSDIMSFNSEGYYKTKDIVHINKEGLYVYDGRINDIIKIGGRKVSIGGIEQKINKLDNISQSFVCVIETKSISKILGIFIKISSNINCNISVVYEQIGNILDCKIRYRIYIVNEFPRLPSGKIDKALLRESIIKQSHLI